MKFNYENLEVSQLALELITQVYLLCKKFPSEEKFGLSSQIKRSVNSILLNIAEGSGKYSKVDFSRFIRMALGSLLETDAGIKIAIKLKYVSEKDVIGLRKLIEKLYYKLIGLEKSLIGKRNK